MSEIHVTDENLMAYVDGELGDAMAAAVEAAMARDGALVRRAAEFVRSRRLVRQAFAAAPMTVPEALKTAVDAKLRTLEAEPEAALLPAAPRERRQGAWDRARMPLAAAIAAIVAGGLGYLAGERATGPAAPVGALVAALEGGAAGRLLDILPSGAETEFAGRRLRIIATYRLGDGAVCREVGLAPAAEAPGGVRIDAVACRGDRWKVMAAVAESAEPAGYAPAAGGDAIGAYLDGAGADEPLAGQAEAAALAERAPAK
jgi:hypothetical protein